MLIDRQIRNLRSIYTEYPNQFWVLVTAAFVDRLGGALLFPFFTLYVTQRFNVGMTEVGLLFGVFAGAGLFGSVVGGALTDRLGRKGVVILGLVASGLASLAMGLADTIEMFALIAVLAGLFGETGRPAQDAMVADLLPVSKRSDGFGILRVAFNLAVTVGPAVGGLLATRSYLWLFACDATSSVITAAIVAVALAETKPQASGVTQPDQGSMWQTLRGYRDVLQDHVFVAFVAISFVSVLVYMQMNTTLAVYLRDVHGVSARGFGVIMSLNAALVVLFQFPITRRISRFRPMLVMAAGSLLYAVGFGAYGFVTTYGLFLGAMVIITLGEMLVVPVSQSIVARMAPETMRGRYMAVYGLSWGVPFGIGTVLAGLVMDYYDPRWVWYAAGIIGFGVTLAYLVLYKRTELSAGVPSAGGAASTVDLEAAEMLVSSE